MLVWFEQRLRLKEFLARPVFTRGANSWLYLPGIIFLCFLAMQFITGIILAFYCADPEMVSSSPELLRSLHSAGAGIVVWSCLTYLLIGLYNGHYRKPGELAWIALMLLLLTTLIAIITGSMLSCDSMAEKNFHLFRLMTRRIPILGSFFRTILGQNLQMKMNWHKIYIFHITVLPIMLMASGTAYLWLFSRKMRKK